MNTELFKILLSVVIFLAGWVGGWLPLKRGAEAEGSRFMSWGNAFAAGVFLGTGLIHLLGAAHRAWLELGWTYPMAPLLAACGFMVTLLVEHVLVPQSAHEIVHAHSGDQLPQQQVDRLASGPYPSTLLLALSIHSVLAGVALGVQQAVVGAIYIFVAIIAHKSAAAFALGVTLARSSVPLRRAQVLVVFFALTTPVGIFVGATMGYLLRSAVGDYFDATFVALAAGTFIYIAAVDIIQDEFLRAGGRLAKWLFAAAAVALMALLSRWI